MAVAGVMGLDDRLVMGPGSSGTNLPSVDGEVNMEADLFRVTRMEDKNPSFSSTIWSLPCSVFALLEGRFLLFTILVSELNFAGDEKIFGAELRPRYIISCQQLNHNVRLVVLFKLLVHGTATYKAVTYMHERVPADKP